MVLPTPLPPCPPLLAARMYFIPFSPYHTPSKRNTARSCTPSLCHTHCSPSPHTSPLPPASPLLTLLHTALISTTLPHTLLKEGGRWAAGLLTALHPSLRAYPNILMLQTWLHYYLPSTAIPLSSFFHGHPLSHAPTTSTLPSTSPPPAHLHTFSLQLHAAHSHTCTH